MEPKRILENIEVDEVSVVDKPANKQSFLFWKSEEGPKMLDTLINFMKDLSGDKEYVAKALDYETSGILQSALNLIATYKEDFPDDLKNAIMTIVNFASSLIPEKLTKEVATNAEPEVVAKVEEVAEVKAVEPVVAVTKVEEPIITKVEVEVVKVADVVVVDTKVEPVVAITKSDMDVLINGLETKMTDLIKAVMDRLGVVEKTAGIRKGIEGQDVTKSNGLKFNSLDGMY